MKPGNVVDILIGTQLDKASMVMTGEYPAMNRGVKPSGGHNQCSSEPDSIAMSQGGVDIMSIRSWAGAHCFVAASKTPDVLTRQLFHVFKKRQGFSRHPNREGDMPFRGFGRRFLKILKSAPPLEEQVVIVGKLDCWQELRQRQFEYHLDKRWIDCFRCVY